MLAHSTTAIVARNDVWTGASASEPYECGWAREAIVWIRAMAKPQGDVSGVKVHVQISPDGIRWLDEAAMSLPSAEGSITWAKVREFGNWLRVAAHLPDGTSLKVLVTITAKG